MHKLALGISLVLFFSSVSSVKAAELYFDPSQGTYGRGDTFIMGVRVDSEDECINAAEVDISYDTSVLRAVDFSRGSSIFTLWVEEPKIDTQKGVIHFSGGVPGGYCGRIKGDPVLTNVIGKVVFTVIGAEKEKTTVQFVTSETKMYLNDGLGSLADVGFQDAEYSIVKEPQLKANQWLSEVNSDTTAPDPFHVSIQSTRGVFSGNYYLVFSTVDKQSGLDHFEIFERGAWKSVSSPYQLRTPFVQGGIQLKAIDKAGNERLGDVATTTPPRQGSLSDYALLWSAIIGLLVLALIVWIRERRLYSEEASPPPAQS